MSRDDDKFRECESKETENFVSRWSRRKTEARHVVDEDEGSCKTPPAESLKVDQESGHPPDQPCDTDMPPLDSLGEDSDYSGFMSPKVSEELRTLALRKLFHLPQFNVTDGLNDYDEDYTSFTKLGNVLTHDMRRLRELEEKLDVKGNYDESGDVEQTAASSETDVSNQLEDSAILEPEADAEKSDDDDDGKNNSSPHRD